MIANVIAIYEKLMLYSICYVPNYKIALSRTVYTSMNWYNCGKIEGCLTEFLHIRTTSH